MWHRKESLPQMSQIHTDGTEANRLSERIFSYAFTERAIVGRQVISNTVLYRRAGLMTVLDPSAVELARQQ